jgi:selenide, water dikinase
VSSFVDFGIVSGHAEQSFFGIISKMIAPLPLIKDLVLIGGGHAHALVLRMWGMDPMPGVRITVINPDPVAPYTGMLPGHIAGHYTRDDLMIDLVRLARFADARVILDRATGIDRINRQVLLQGRPPLAYDVASVDTGIGSGLPEIPGYADYATSAKPLGDYADRWGRFLMRALPEPRLVVIGAGVGGVELALASAHRLRTQGANPAITLLEQGETALPHIGAGTRQALLRHLASAGIALRTGVTATRITADGVDLSDGTWLPSDFTLSVAGSRPQSWLAGTGLDLQDGFVTVGPTLQSSDPTIFAAGDCAYLSHAPRPKAGVFAVRAAPILNHNLRAALSGARMRPFHPQSDYLKLISTGGKGAVADKFGLRSGGSWLWHVKDRIDRAFMAKFADYPEMATAPALPAHAALGLAEALAEKPLCGGCGAKIGAMDLSAALSDLPAPARIDVLSGPGDDAAILRHGTGGCQVITTDHLRSFSNDTRLMARITAVHAMGDIWAMGATPQAGLAQITLPRMSPAMQADALREIMTAAAEIFTLAGADIVGGHTSVGAELTIGFTVTGLTDHPITKSGARPGDALILTKPLGTGTLLAAEMAMDRIPGQMLGEAVAATFASMTRSLGPAAAVLSPHAHAMTDVTGFGLAGHLMEMLLASSCRATLQLAAIPLLPGAEALAAAGQASSLAPANRAATNWRMTFDESPRAALLFDPQTSGGLLAAVPGDAAPSILHALHGIGEPAAIIGHVHSGTAWITVAA